MARTSAPKYRLEIETPSNGRAGKSTVNVLDAGDEIVHTGHFDLRSDEGRRKAARDLAASPRIPGADEKWFAGQLEGLWTECANQRRRMRKQAEAGSPEAAPVATVELLDEQPEAIRRPLCRAGGRAYAAAWCPARTTISR